MTKYNVVIKNWKTGEIISTYNNVTAEELVEIEANHQAYAQAAWDLEFEEVDEE